MVSHKKEVVCIRLSSLTWFMEYGDAHISVLFNVGVPDVCDHFEFRRPQRVLFGEYEVALEEPALVQRV